MSSEIEQGGLLFKKIDKLSWIVHDMSYGCRVGRLVVVDGPGPILEDITASFLDWGQMNTIANFINTFMITEEMK